MKWDAKTKSSYFLLGILGILSLYILYLIRSLLVPFFTAVILTVICFPVYKKLKKIWGKPRLSSLCTVLLLMFVVIIPLTFIFIGLLSQSVGMYNTMRDFSPESAISAWQDSISFIGDSLGIEIDESITNTVMDSIVRSSRNALWSTIQFATGKLAKVLIETIFTLFFMYYLFIHGKKMYGYFEAVMPINDTSKKLLSKEIYKDIQALFLGQGLVALVQGAVGYIGFLIFGIPNALFWGFVMAILSFIPVVGAWLVWLPISIVLLINGEFFVGFGLMLYGSIIVGNIDNVLRPYLVSSFSKIHFLVILVGVYVGVQAFDLIGLILGPLIISIALTLAKIYYTEHVK